MPRCRDKSADHRLGLHKPPAAMSRPGMSVSGDFFDRTRHTSFAHNMSNSIIGKTSDRVGDAAVAIVESVGNAGVSIMEHEKSLIVVAVMAYAFAIFNISMDKFGGEHYVAQQKTVVPFVVGMVAMTASGVGVCAAKSGKMKASLYATIFSFAASAVMGIITWDQHDKAKKNLAEESGDVKIKDDWFWWVYKSVVVAELLGFVVVAGALGYVWYRQPSEGRSDGETVPVGRSRSDAVIGPPPTLEMMGVGTNRSRSATV